MQTCASSFAQKFQNQFGVQMAVSEFSAGTSILTKDLWKFGFPNQTDLSEVFSWRSVACFEKKPVQKHPKRGTVRAAACFHVVSISNRG